MSAQEKVLNALAAKGWQARVVSSSNLAELQEEIERLLAGTKLSLLPEKTRDTLEWLHWTRPHEQGILARNLGALLKK